VSGSPGRGNLAVLGGCLLWAGVAACAGPATTAPDSAPPLPAGHPQRVVLEVRDLLAGGEPRVTEATLRLDGVAYRTADGILSVELAPGPHSLAVHHPGYRPDLFALRLRGDQVPWAQVVGAQDLVFNLRPGEAQADLLLVARSLDVPFFVSLLDGGVSRRWSGTVDLHIDRSRTPSGYAPPAERTEEVAAFVKSALEEMSAGSVTLGRVSTGTGLDWKDFLDSERPGAITLQFWDELRRENGEKVGGWALYREEPHLPGLIRSANIILDVESMRLGRDFRPRLGHELGHALSLQHPWPCRRWSRMDAAAGECRSAPAVEVLRESFWSPADRAAGKLIHAFLPGTDFARLPAVPADP
jgi:hypothetical protein